MNKGILRNIINTKFKRHMTLYAGVFIVLLFIVTGVFAKYTAPHDPIMIDMEHRLMKPSLTYPFGTDYLGRCVLSRIIYGIRTSLFSSILVLIIVMAIGIPIGIISGYAGGITDNIIMRITDTLLAFPSLILTLAIASMLGPSLMNLLIALVSVRWTNYARIVRGIVLQLKEMDFITAAKACGTSDLNIIKRHILLNSIKPVIVLAAQETGNIILSISGLSFIGLGAQPPIPEWGAMLTDSRSFIETAPNLMLFPGITIMVVVMAFNCIGESVREILNHEDSI